MKRVVNWIKENETPTNLYYQEIALKGRNKAMRGLTGRKVPDGVGDEWFQPFKEARHRIFFLFHFPFVLLAYSRP